MTSDWNWTLDKPTPLGGLLVIVRNKHQNPGDLVHLDIKKFGRIPEGGGQPVTRLATGNRNKTTPMPTGARAMPTFIRRSMTNPCLPTPRS